MITISVVMAVLLLLAGIGHMVMGIYAIYMNYASRINRIFLLATIALFIWAVSFSVAVVSPTVDVVLFWRRVSAVGWGSFYALTLHFIILLTRSKDLSKPQPPRWQSYLLYLPALVTLFAFSLYDPVVISNYNLEETYFGWRNFNVDTLWDSFFNFYYISYSLAGIFLLWRWRSTSPFIRERRQATLIVGSFLMAFVFGSLTDSVLDYFTNVSLPELAVVFLLIPIFSMLYSIRKYGVITLSPSQISEDIVETMNDALLLLDYNGYIQRVNPAGCKLLGYETNQLLGRNIQSLFFTKANVATYIEEYRKHPVPIDGREVNMVSSGKEPVPALFSAAPILDRYHELLGIVCIFSDMRTIKKREEELRAMQDELEVKVAERTKDLAYLNGLQNILLEVSTEFISVTKETLAEKTLSMLEKVGSFIGADRACSYRIDRESSYLIRNNQWSRNGRIEALGSMEVAHLSVINKTYEGIRERKHLFSRDVLSLEDSEPLFVDEMRKYQVKSLLAIAVETDKELYGVISFDTVDQEADWDVKQIQILKLIANIMADGVSKVKSEQNIHHLAYYDHLTALPNRIKFTEQLINQLQDVSQLAVLFIDLDNFKMINDTLGHSKGDVILQKIGHRLNQVIEPYGVLSRVGGDEFVAYVNLGDSPVTFEGLMKTLFHQLEAPVYVEDDVFRLSASVGIALYPEDGETSEELIRNADTAMYVAKENGRNGYQVCTHEMKEEINLKSRLVGNLHNAIENQELAIHYQPQVNLETGEISGIEALLRWHSKELGNISPAVFIPLAERHGLITLLGDWVFKEVFRTLQRWEQEGLPAIKTGINVSIQQLKEVDFVDKVREDLKRYQVNPRNIEIEITESVAMNESKDIFAVLHQLRAMGIEIAIDDFGTEYSSLKRLKEMPIDRIKIDKEFIDDISEGSKNHAIIRTITLLAENLGVQVIVEGVETQEQLDVVKGYHCQYAQGYFFYYPMGVEALEPLLKQSISK